MKFKVGDKVRETGDDGRTGIVRAVCPEEEYPYNVDFDGCVTWVREWGLLLAEDEEQSNNEHDHKILSKEEIAALLSGIDSDIYKDNGMAKVRKQGRDLLEQAYSCGWHDGYAGGKRDAEETAKTERTGKWKRVTGEKGKMKIVCSECGGTMEQKHINFCAVCGARMVSIV